MINFCRFSAGTSTTTMSTTPLYRPPPPVTRKKPYLQMLVGFDRCCCLLGSSVSKRTIFVAAIAKCTNVIIIIIIIIVDNDGDTISIDRTIIIAAASHRTFSRRQCITATNAIDDFNDIAISIIVSSSKFTANVTIWYLFVLCSANLK